MADDFSFCGAVYINVKSAVVHFHFLKLCWPQLIFKEASRISYKGGQRTTPWLNLGHRANHLQLWEPLTGDGVFYLKCTKLG